MTRPVILCLIGTFIFVSDLKKEARRPKPAGFLIKQRSSVIYLAFLYLLMMPSPAMPAPRRMRVEGSGAGVGVLWFMTMLSMDGQNQLVDGTIGLRAKNPAVLTWKSICKNHFISTGWRERAFG